MTRNDTLPEFFKRQKTQTAAGLRKAAQNDAILNTDYTDFTVFNQPFDSTQDRQDTKFLVLLKLTG
jgi:hypothetical protein